MFQILVKQHLLGKKKTTKLFSLKLDLRVCDACYRLLSKKEEQQSTLPVPNESEISEFINNNNVVTGMFIFYIELGIFNKLITQLSRVKKNQIEKERTSKCNS